MKGIRVGFIGLGNLGLRLILNIIVSGANIFIFDEDDNKDENFRDKNVSWLTSPKEIAENVDIVITCLRSPEVVAFVVESKNGLLEGLSPKKLWVEMSTTDS